MKKSSQDQIIAALEEKIVALQEILEETILKHSDTEYDLKDLRDALKEIENYKIESSGDKMLVMAEE